jgi:deaminated glutathione amidase
MAERTPLTVSVVQMESGPDKVHNVARAIALTSRAIDEGATLIALPETFDYRGSSSGMQAIAEALPGSTIGPLMALARQHRVWIVAGSVHESDAAGGMPYNTSVLIGPHGDIAAKYRKIHLFDIVIGDKSVTESSKYQRGDQVVVADAAGVRLGLTICYDLRFPELYRLLADAGAEVICIPSSFTAPTGEAHWEVLVRARAIENQCFVLAPGQAGVGAGGIATYGNSMIVDPWGRVLARASSQEEGVISATLDFDEMADIRRRLPALHNRKLAAIR